MPGLKGSSTEGDGDATEKQVLDLPPVLIRADATPWWEGALKVWLWTAVTMTAREAVTAARAFSDAGIVPAHVDGWAHCTEGRAEVDGAFTGAGLANRLRWVAPGEPTVLG